MRAASRLGWAGLFLVCSWLVACQALLGGFEIDEDPPDETGSCGEGQWRCVDANLFCARDVQGGGEDLTLLQRCNSAAECDSDHGRCTVCEPDKFRCDGAKLERCNSEQTGFDLVTTCETAGECNVASGECRACNPGETQCSGADQRDFLECGSDHLWGPPQTCETKELCAASVSAALDNPDEPHACVPPACPAPGAYQCVSDVELYRCLAGQVAWEYKDTCKSPELCTATIADPTQADANGGRCVPPVCEPAGTHRCVLQPNGTDTVLEVCHADLLGWGYDNTCTLPVVCNTMPGECTGPCSPGDTQCNEGFLETCSDRQLWDIREDCGSPALCKTELDPETQLPVSSMCIPPGCDAPSTYSCDGAKLLFCPPDRSAWQEVETCGSPALCKQADGRCDPIVCEPGGAVRCNPSARLEHQVCAEDLTGWVTDTTCESTQSCNDSGSGDACIDECPEPSEVCRGNQRQVCTGDTGGPVWNVVATCPTTDLCECGLEGGDDCLGGTSPSDGDICGIPICGGSAGPTSRCKSGDAHTLETCESGRNGWTESDCDITCKAQGNSAYCAACDVGETECTTATSLRTCNSTSQLWNNATMCPLGCVEPSTGADYCAACADGDAECTGAGNNSLRTCDDATQLWSNASSCSLGCKQVTNGPDYCKVCAPADTECVSGGLRACDGPNGVWKNPTPCSIACIHPSTGEDYCAECAAGEAKCMGAGLQTCDPDTGRWTPPEACSVSCYDETGNADYCTDCVTGNAECVSPTERRVCDAAGHWPATPESCALGCFGTSPSAYCGVCDEETDCNTGEQCVSGLCQNP